MQQPDQETRASDFPERVLALLSAHCTWRAFEDTPLADETVQRAVRAAQMASTSSNVQAYSLLRVRDAKTRAQLAHWAGDQAQVAEAGGFFVLSADQRRHALVAKDQNKPYAPNLETFMVAVIDTALFAQNLALAFEAQGLGICMIGGLRTRLGEVDRLLELPQNVFPLFGLCVGVPKSESGADPKSGPKRPLSRPRLPLSAIMAEERYPDDDCLRAAIADYDITMGTYYRERGQPGYDWSAGLARKFERPQREHLRSFYTSKGASLE